MEQIESDSDGNEEYRDPDAEAIVQRLEQKYGTGAVGGKFTAKRRKAVRFEAEDIMDKGMGYDLTDNFIDDSAAYDEWVPSSMDTAKGGHYVNRGPLEFRQIDSDASSDDEDDEEEDDEKEDESEDDDASADDMEDNSPPKLTSASSASVTTVVTVVSVPPPQFTVPAPTIQAPAVRASASASSLSGPATHQPISQTTPVTTSGNLVHLSEESEESPELNIATARLSQVGMPPTRRLKGYSNNSIPP